MDEQKQARVCYCRDCNQLDYATDSCPSCGGKNIVVAYQDFLVGYGRHINLMNTVYEHHFENGTKVFS